MKLQAVLPILALSFMQTARAATFDTAQSGNWSDPLSWTAGVGYPDTYGSDNAIINVGHVINYDDVGGGNGPMTTPVGAVPLKTGGFAIAGGNSVTIDGGTLTQATLNLEMRVGEGTGGAGTGTLTIQTGGTLNTGASIGLAVGTKISGATAGGGLLEIKDGLLKLGAGASVGGLGVGLDASTGVLNVGDGAGAANTAIVDLATENIRMGIGVKFGALPAGTGTVTVAADGRINFGTADITVGGGGGTGTLAVQTGGTVSGAAGTLIIGDGAGSAGTLTNAGSISNTGGIRIGTAGGMGTLTMTAGALTSTGEFNVAQFAGSTGTANFNGGTASLGQIVIGRDGGTGNATVAGAAVTANGSLYVGNGGNGAGGTGTLTINSGTVHATGFTRIGDNNGGGVTPTGNLIISGGALNSDDYIAVGSDGGVGHVTQTGGSVTFNNWISMGLGGGAAGSSWDISGGNITSGAGMEVGSDRDATMTIGGAANVSIGSYSIGVRGGSNGHVTMTGGTLTASSILVAGRQGGTSSGDMTISGGTVNLTGGGANDVNNDFTVGNQNGSSGTLNVSGGTLNFNGHHLVVGGNEGTATGLVNITGGTFNNVGWFHVGSIAGSSGTVNINLANPLAVVTANQLYVGNNGAANGTVSVTSGTLRVNDFGEVGRGGGTGTLNVVGANAKVISAANGGDPFFNVGVGAGNGTVNILNGGQFTTTNTWFTIGRDNGSIGETTVSGTGSSLSSVGLIVGWSGSGQGTLNISNNGVVNNNGRQVSIGRDHANTVGIINIASGGVLNSSQDTLIGHNGYGTVNLTGGTLNNTGGWVYVGTEGPSHGTVNMGAGSTVAVSGQLLVGNNGGQGVFNQTGGTTNVAQEFNLGRTGGHGTLNLSGGTFNVNGWTTMGKDGGSGDGTINVSNTGVFNHAPSGSGDFLIGWTNGSSGAVNVTAGGTINYNWWVRAGIDPGSTGSILVSGAGSTFNMNTGRVYIGERGSGTLTVSAGGKFLQTSGDQFNVGGNDNSSTGDGFGTLTVTGAGSLVSTNNFIRAGFGNTGSSPAVGNIVVNTGGTISSGGWIGVGHDGGDGTLNMNNGTLTTGNELYVGIDDNGHTRQTTGLANVLGGSTVDIGSLYIGRNGGAGTFNLNGGTVTVHREAKIGNGGIGSGGSQTIGTLNVIGAGSNVAAFTDGGNDFFRVGVAGGKGVVKITAGGTLTTNAGWFTLGENDNSVGTALVSGTGSFLHTNGLIVGWNQSGIGTLTIDHNAVVTNVGHEVSIGRDQPNTQGTININSGGVLNAGAETRIGHNGIGLVNINGGTMNMQGGGWAILGDGGTANGTLNMSSGSVNVTADRFVLGQNAGAVGTYNQTGGTTQVANEFNVGRGGGTGTLNLSGGTFNVNGWTTLGRDGAGTGTMNISNGAVFNHATAGGGDFLIGWVNGSNGAVNVTNGGKVNYSWWTRVGVDPGSTGSILVDGAGSVFTQSDGRLYIGEKSTGSLTITNGGVYTHRSGYEFGVGEQDGGAAGGTGTVTVSGAGSTLNNDNFIRVGHGSTGAVGGIGIVNLTAGGTINAGNWMGFGHEGGDGTLNMTGGAITFANEFYVGIDDNGHTRTTTGAANITGGTITQTGGGAGIFIGRNGGAGVVNLNGANPITLTSLNEVNVGQGGVGAGGGVGTGTLNVANANAAVSASNGFWIGRDGGSGLLNQSTGAISGGDIRIGTGGGASGTVALSGGLITAVRDLTVGWQSNAVGNLTVSGGAINVGTDAYIGVRDTATGNFLMSAGTMSVGGALVIAGDAGTTGNMQFNGGTIQAGIFINGGGAASVNFNGGTVKAGQNQGNFFNGFTPGMSEVQTGGLIFHSNGFTATANNIFDGPGGITKIGNGTLALTAANTYAGGTVINTGTLNINADAALGAAAAGVAVNNNSILQAAANLTSNRSVTLGTGGGTIDTNGHIITLDTLGAVSGTALTKAGNGILNIKAAQTYNSLTANGGVTNIYTPLGTGTSTITANAPVNIYVSQTLSALTIAAGVEVAFGDGLPFASGPGKLNAGPLGGSVVPEPGSIGLLAVGLLALTSRRRRSR